jgi:cell fate regulator YaaT (PSP1 superfamily)
MIEIIGVRFRSGGKQYYFDPCGITVESGQGVIIETARGIEYGECVQGNTMVEDEKVVQPLRPLIRVATEEDIKNLTRNQEKERRAFQICQQKILNHKLEMKLVDVEYNFEGSKILFFFTAEGRVDFRALVKDLASVFHTRIELRQIGVRDEAKMMGGLGICGRPFCCASFMDDFQPVSIKMAKTQNLSLNPTKISGTCGRLMCCLKYEQGAYEDAVRRCPKQESFVETPDGVGTVSAVDLLREQVKVRLEDSNDAPKSYHNCEICVVRSGKGKRPEGYEPPPAEELEKRRWVELKSEPEWEDEKSASPSALSAALEAVLTHKDEKAPQPRRERRTGESRPHPRRKKPTGEEKPEKSVRPEGTAATGKKKPRPPRAKPAAQQQAAPPKKEGGNGQQQASHRFPYHRRRRRNGGTKPPQEPPKE